MSNLVYHYQPVQHDNKEYLHEAFSTKDGVLFMVNPLPVEVEAASQDEIDMLLQAMETDNKLYKSIPILSILIQMERWQDEIDIMVSGFNEPVYEDEDIDLMELDNLDSTGEVIDICEYFKGKR